MAEALLGPRVAFAPGRVNLIGEHTDYTGGFCLPMAVELGTTVRFRPEPNADEVVLTSDAAGGEDGGDATGGGDGGDAAGGEHGRGAEARIPLGAAAAPAAGWARHPAAVVRALGLRRGGRGTVRTTLPLGAGLSSSASLHAALTLALGFRGTPLELARFCRMTEDAATGLRGGMLDQLAICLAEPGSALLLDCAAMTTRPVAVPEGAEVVVVHSGVRRSLDASAYNARVAECAAAEALIGPLRDAGASDVSALADPVLRRRARHVVTENARVHAFVAALAPGTAGTAGTAGTPDLAAAGRLLHESHESLRADYEVSTPELDHLAAALEKVGGVHGARLTGAGFGGCVIALADAGAVRPPFEGLATWVVHPSGGARLTGA